MGIVGRDGETSPAAAGGTDAVGYLRGASRGPFIVAHRGASESAPENTLPAFELALEAGCTVLECDVHLSRDSHVVVIHDATLQRTTDGAGNVAECNWNSLRHLDAGYGARFGDRFAGTRLLRLQDVLDLARGRAQVMVEVKADAVGPQAGGIEELCLAAGHATGMLEQLAVISMQPVALRRIRALASQVTTGLVFGRHRRRRLVRETVSAGADFLIAHVGTLLRDGAIVRRAGVAGVRVGAYVVNEEQALRSLVRGGVESLASDRPLPMIQELKRQRPGDAVEEESR